MNDLSTFDDIVSGILTDIKITEKHDPNAIGYNPRPGEPYRSIFTNQMSGSLGPYIRSENYSINVYRKQNGQYFSTLVPDDLNDLPPVIAIASGSSANPGEVLDTLIYASGSIQGYHPFAGSSQNLHQMTIRNEITLVNILHK